MDKLFIIDGHALIFRMYYALLNRPMVNSKGQDTSILYGFTKYILELVQRENPTHLAVAFDPPVKTFRHDAYAPYKANRMVTPEPVKAAFEPLVELMGALDIPVLMVPGYEADDVICSAARKFVSDNMKVYMVTPDKDFGQCVGGNIYQYKPGKSGGEAEILDEAAVCAAYGVSRSRQVIDILAIWGDQSDNVPGVTGVGKVGAGKLVSKYGSVENIYSHIEELTPRTQEAFRAAEEHISMSKFLVTIKDDINLDTRLDDLKVDISYNAEVRRLFEHYEFPSLAKILPSGDGEALNSEVKYLEYSEIPGNFLLEEIYKDRIVSVEVSDKIILAVGNKCAAFALSDAQALKVLSDETVAKCGFGLKNSMHKAGMAFGGRLFDIEVMHYLVDASRSHKIDYLLSGYMDIHFEAKPREAAPQVVQLDLFSAAQPEITDAADDTPQRVSVASFLLVPYIKGDLEKNGVYDLYENVEMPLISTLYEMEKVGVKVDVAQLKEFGRALSDKIAALEQQIREIASDPMLNVQSPRQIGVLLYERLALDPKAKKTRSGAYPTDEETLAAIADRHPVVDMILEYRGLRKLLGTYIEPFPTYINPEDGRVHTTFTQALTATGRLSSVKPNLQNIPVRSDLGQEIRRAFVPEADYIVSADYSQIELRIMAHLSEDEGLIEDFRKGDDIHTLTASKIFRVPVGEVTKEQRRRAKTANFGIMYGISPFGLSQRLKIPRSEAKSLIEDYFNSFAGVKSYIEKVVEQTSANGYVETLLGRRRYLPDIASGNSVVRSLAERNAVNAPIQGSSADIIKMAMNAIHKALKQGGFRSRMVLQIHDELLFDVYADELEAVEALVREKMENVCSLRVPLIVDCNHGTNWLEAH
ncbi:MAG: DNA polymerase I [Bacteroidales bacterium]|nr:DNA polymerase I [Bacteroidales bacterium]